MPIETEVYKIRIDPSTFDSLTPTERALACIVGNAQTEVATLTKLLAWTGGSPSHENFDDDARDAMRHCVMRLLILKLRELYKTLTVDANKKRDKIRPSLFKSFEKLKQFDDALGTNGYLTKIRHELSVHYWLEDWETNCALIDINLYRGYRLSDRLAGNAFYSFADLISMLTMFGIEHEVEIRDSKHSFDKFYKVFGGLISMVPHFLEVIDELLTELLGIGDGCESETHRVTCELAFEEIKIPWLAPFSG